jgi:ABC-type sugar transport system permease subunit
MTTTVAAPPARAERAGGTRRSRVLTTPDKVTLVVMAGIPTLIQFVLVWAPMVLSIILSFMKWNGLSLSDIKSAGLTNYQFIVKDYPPFWPAVAHNIIWLLFLACVATPLGLLLAVLLDQTIRGSRIYQSIFFVPVMLSLPLIGIIWQLMYARNEGFINNIVGIANTPAAVDWFGNSSVNLWAALIPAMKPINIVVVVITIIEALRAFDIVYIINRGTNGLELIGALVVQNLVGEGQVIGIGSALAVMLLVVSLVPITIYLSRVFGSED